MVVYTVRDVFRNSCGPLAVKRDASTRSGESRFDRLRVLKSKKDANPRKVACTGALRSSRLYRSISSGGSAIVADKDTSAVFSLSLKSGSLDPKNAAEPVYLRGLRRGLYPLPIADSA